MKTSQRVIAFMNIAHFIDHYAMLIFAAAVIVIAPAFEMNYSALLPYATPGFIAFGAGSLISGWLGDKWSRRNMMSLFFLGMGLTLIGVSLTHTAFQLGIALFFVGIIASIYHPVGTSLLVANVEQLGREMGINGMWGNFGVASSALITGVINQYVGWRYAFFIPGVCCLLVGILFVRMIPPSIDIPSKKSSLSTARLPKSAMKWVFISLVITVIASSTTFNAITVALPKIFEERLHELTSNTASLGILAFLVYLFGALSQFIVGQILDKKPLKKVFLPFAIGIVPALYFASNQNDYFILILSIIIIIGIFGQVTINDFMLGKYTADEWRGRAYSARYFLGFTAAGLSVGLVSMLYQSGGFALLLQALAVLSLLTVLGALVFPGEKEV